MLAIIPARGGSKGLPDKNIKVLGGKPLIQWKIDAALNAESIERVILSTDSKKIANICRNTGIEIPFMRPSYLSQDNSSSIDVYNYTINKLRQEDKAIKDEYVVLLPTVPFVTSQDIDNAVEMFKKNSADSVISCKKMPFPKEWIFDVDINNKIVTNNEEEISLLPRQKYSSSYIANGGIYVLRHSLVSVYNSYYFKNTLAYEMPEERSIDIDTIEDFKLAEYTYENLYK